MTARDHTIRLQDGRRLGFRIAGDSQGRPVVVLHGTPGSRAKFDFADRHARTLGLCLISPDRWGYGLTDRPRHAHLAGFAADMANLADHLGHVRFGVVGVSGGGPFAAAVAAMLAPRVTALALVAPVGPMHTADDRAGMRLFHRFCFRALPRMPGGMRLTFAAFAGLLRLSPRAAVHLASARAVAHDKRTVRQPATSAHLAQTFKLGLTGALSGPVLDMKLFARPWDVPLHHISAPARLWLGSADRNVPLEPARTLSRLIRTCTLVEMPGEGHFWITHAHWEVLQWLRVSGVDGSQPS